MFATHGSHIHHIQSMRINSKLLTQRSIHWIMRPMLRIKETLNPVSRSFSRFFFFFWLFPFSVNGRAESSSTVMQSHHLLSTTYYAEEHHLSLLTIVLLVTNATRFSHNPNMMLDQGSQRTDSTMCGDKLARHRCRDGRTPTNSSTQPHYVGISFLPSPSN